MKNIAIFASGGGSNFKAIYKLCKSLSNLLNHARSKQHNIKKYKRTTIQMLILTLKDPIYNGSNIFEKLFF